MLILQWRYCWVLFQSSAYHQQRLLLYYTTVVPYDTE